MSTAPVAPVATSTVPTPSAAPVAPGLMGMTMMPSQPPRPTHYWHTGGNTGTPAAMPATRTSRRAPARSLRSTLPGRACDRETNSDTAKKTEEVDDTNSRVAIENARQGLVLAQNALDSDRSDFRPNIDAQAGVVANALAALALAQRDVNNSVLYAPVAGTISAINGAVGEFMTGAGSGTTALAPGTDAGIPGVGAAATSDQSASNSSISATKPGGSSFIQMNNINSFQVVVPFEESDAAKVAPNQKVEVTFDAIPDLTRDGTVLSISPGGVNISGVTNYYATVLLTNSDPRLRSGQTAEAGVLVNALDNVLVVPNSAIIKRRHIQLPQATVQPSTGGAGDGGGRGGG